jgi:hypothetical protein
MEGSLKHVQYLADTALVVAKHRGCLELISQTARLLLSTSEKTLSDAAEVEVRANTILAASAHAGRNLRTVRDLLRSKGPLRSVAEPKEMR